MFLLGMLIGGWIGATLAVLAMCALSLAREADERDAREHRKKPRAEARGQWSPRRYV